MHAGFWWGDLRERNYLEELSVDSLCILTQLNGNAGANANSGYAQFFFLFAGLDKRGRK
jgi:hypothetical protein